MARISNGSGAGRLADGRIAILDNKQGIWTCPGIDRIAEARLESIRGLPKDCEGMAVADDGSVWVIGSHFNGVESEKLVRLSPDLRTVKNSVSLRPIIEAKSTLGAWDFLRPALRDRTLNIEGLAFARGSLIVGLRAPLIDGKAVLLRIDSAAKLGPMTPPISAALVDLRGLGVRDLCGNSNRVLISAGGTVDGRAQFHMRAVTASTLELIPSFDVPLQQGGHWEGILGGHVITVLADADAGVPTWTVPGVSGDA